MYFTPIERGVHLHPLTPEEPQRPCHLLQSWLNSCHHPRVMLDIGYISGYPKKWYSLRSPSIDADFLFLPMSPSSILQLVSEPILHDHGSPSKAVGAPVHLSTPALLVLCPCVVLLGHLAVMVSGCSLWDRNNTAQQTSLQESELNTQNQARSSYTGNGLVPLSDGELCFFMLSRELSLFSCSGLGTLKIQDLHRLGYVSERPLLSSHIKSFSFNATIPGLEICVPSLCSTPLDTISSNLWKSRLLFSWPKSKVTKGVIYPACSQQLEAFEVFASRKGCRVLSFLPCLWAVLSLHSAGETWMFPKDRRNQTWVNICRLESKQCPNREVR